MSIRYSITASFGLVLAACSGEAPTPTDAAEATEQVEMTGFSARPTSQRIPLVDPDNLTPAQAEMLASRADYNIYKTLAQHTELYNRWSPLGQAILNNENISPRHREIAMLRMGWLCQSEYEWAQHARIANGPNVGMTPEEIRNIAVGPEAEGWSEIDVAVINMADELRYDGMISDATWEALGETYTDEQVIELMFTSAQYQLVSMALNSLGVQLDPELEFRLPDDLPLPLTASRPGGPRLAEARIGPFEVSQLSAEQAELISTRVRDDGSVLNLYSTMIVHPRLYEAWLGFMGFVFGESGLPPAHRELVILRTGWNWNAEYEYAHHRPLGIAAGLTEEEVDRVPAGPGAAGWSEEQRLVLTAADELRAQAFITDETWAGLKQFYSDQQLVELVYTVGGYAMTALAINSLGIQIEPGYSGYPAQ